MKNLRKHKVSVLFTRYSSTFSNIVYWLSGRGYTHASISLEENEDTFYSFNFRGLCKENPDKMKKHSKKSYCYHIEVTEHEYEVMKERLDEMLAHKEKLRYSRLGVICLFLHLSVKLENCYFCSQFVAELLKEAGCIQLQKKPEKYYPNDLAKALDKQIQASFS